MCVYVYIYIYVYICVFIYARIYVFIYVDNIGYGKEGATREEVEEVPIYKVNRGDLYSNSLRL